MITILSMLEEGYESSFEHLAFRQIKGAYGCKLICVPHHYTTMQEALDAAIGTKIFMLPPGRVDHSVEFKDLVLPEGDVVFVLGSPTENLISYVGDNASTHISTIDGIDLMAVCIAGIIMYVHG